jgi:hypothetical protein
MATRLEEQIRNQWNSTDTKNTNKFSTDETVSDETKGGFSIEVLQFPDYLGTKELNQYILFNINVRGKSEIKQGNEKRIATVKRENTAQQTEDQMALSKNVSLGIGGAVGGAAISQLLTGAARAKRAKSGIPQDALAKSQDTRTVVATVAVAAAAGALLGLGAIGLSPQTAGSSSETDAKVQQVQSQSEQENREKKVNFIN